METWNNKVAIVTGASSGIGAQVAIDLAKAGIDVIGFARRYHLIEKLALKNKDNKGKIIALECDLRSPKSITKAFEWIDDHFHNKARILINVAGIWHASQITGDKLQDEDIVDTINTNFTGLVLCARKACKLIEKTKDDGYIINISSISGYLTATSQMSMGGINIYAGAKHAVNNFTEVLRYETANKADNKIRVTNINPGSVIDTEFYEKADFDYKDCVTGLKPKEISNVILYLLSTPVGVNITELTIRQTNNLL